MKPFLTFIVAGTSLAIAAATVPSIGYPLLDAVVGTAWAQQDRGHGEKNKKEREEKDSDHDRGKGNGHEDRDTDRGGGSDKADKGNNGRDDRDTDRGGGSDKADKGNNGRDDRDTDRGGGSDKADKGNNGRDDTDRGGGRDKGDKGNTGRDDSDRGAGSDKGEKGNNGRDDQVTDRGGGSDKGDRGTNGRDDHGVDRGGGGKGDNVRDADNRPPKNDNSGTNVGGADNDVADRNADPAERARDDADRDRETFAGRFDLDDTETFDNDGFLARRGEIIAMSSDSLLRRRAEAMGLLVVQEEFLDSLNTTMYRIAVPAASPIDGILARLRAQDPQGVFDRNHLYDRSASTVSNNDPGAISHALTGSAKGVTVGLIDTGVDALHPALRGTNVQLSYFVDESRDLPETHGTAVVSLLVSKDFGMLPDAQLYVACVFYEDRRGTALSEARDLVRALDWLMKMRVPVINMSLSGPPNEVLHAAIQRALQAGHLIVAAVGNGGPASPPLYPAAYDGVIAVTAIDGGQRVYRRANRGPYVQLAAPGVDVVAAAPSGRATYSGTSFASPYVAALAAMDYRSLNPQKALEVKQNLQANALDLGKPGRDDVYGFGLARPHAISTAAR